jgi:hypothetical protein
MADLTEEITEVRSKLMMVPREVLTGILEEFGETVDGSKGRPVVAMQADTFFSEGNGRGTCDNNIVVCERHTGRCG